MRGPAMATMVVPILRNTKEVAAHIWKEDTGWAMAIMGTGPREFARLGLAPAAAHLGLAPVDSVFMAVAHWDSAPRDLGTMVLGTMALDTTNLGTEWEVMAALTRKEKVRLTC